MGGDGGGNRCTFQILIIMRSDVRLDITTVAALAFSRTIPAMGAVGAALTARIYLKFNCAASRFQQQE